MTSRNIEPLLFLSQPLVRVEEFAAKAILLKFLAEELNGDPNVLINWSATDAPATILMWMVQHSRNNLIEWWIVTAHADCNVLDTKKVSPLWAATLNKNKKAVRVLLENGANPDLGNDRCPPLSVAVLQKDVEIIEILLANGARVKSNFRDLDVPLTAAVTSQHHHICRLLLLHAKELENPDHPDTFLFKILANANLCLRGLFTKRFVEMMDSPICLISNELPNSAK